MLVTAEFSYNATRHSATNEVPFRSLYGMVLEIHLVGISEPFEEGDAEAAGMATERVRKMHSIKEELSKCWVKSQESAAKYYNRHHKEQNFEVGDQILLSTENLMLRTKKKISQKYISPFYVTERIGCRAYRLKQPEEYKKY